MAEFRKISKEKWKTLGLETVLEEQNVEEVAQMVKNLPAMQGTRVLSLSQEDSLNKGMAYPLQYSCLGNAIDRGAWQGVLKSQTRLNS